MNERAALKLYKITNSLSVLKKLENHIYCIPMKKPPGIT